MKRNDPDFRQFAVHGWFEGVDRGAAATADWIHLHVLPGPRAWAWQIPISAAVTSVGVVCDAERFPKAGDDPGAFFAEAVASSAPLARAHGGRAAAPRAPARGQLQLRDGAARGRRLAPGRRRRALRGPALLVGPLGRGRVGARGRGRDPRRARSRATSRRPRSPATRRACAAASTPGASSSASTTARRAPSSPSSPTPPSASSSATSCRATSTIPPTAPASSASAPRSPASP